MPRGRTARPGRAGTEARRRTDHTAQGLRLPLRRPPARRRCPRRAGPPWSAHRRTRCQPARPPGNRMGCCTAHPALLPGRSERARCDHGRGPRAPAQPTSSRRRDGRGGGRRGAGAATRADNGVDSLRQLRQVPAGRRPVRLAGAAPRTAAGRQYVRPGRSHGKLWAGPVRATRMASCVSPKTKSPRAIGGFRLQMVGGAGFEPATLAV